MPLRDIAVALTLLVFLPKVFFKPHIGVYLWSWVGYMNPHRLGWGFMYNFPVAQVIAIVTLGSFAVSAERKRLPGNTVVFIWIIFLLWVCITTFFAYHPESAMHQFERVLKIQLFVALTLMMINTKERIQNLVWVIALSIGFFGIKGGIFTVLTGGAFRVWGPPGTFITGNNEIGLATIMIIPLLNYMRITVKNKWGKRILLFCIISCGFTVVGTQSRGAFLAGGAMVFFLWLKSSKKIISGLLLFSVVAIILAMMPQKFFDRMSTIKSYEEDGSAMGRINSWHFAYNLASDNFMGGGLGAFSKDLFQYYAPNPSRVLDAHSIYFEVLGEQGFVGLILFLLMGMFSWFNSMAIIKKAKNIPDLDWAEKLAKMLQISLVGYAVGGAFLGLAYFDLPYHILALIILTREIVEKETGYLSPT